MKNFYYEKCRKPRYHKGSPIGWPINRHKPTQPRRPPISIGGGIGEQRGENKRISFTLN